MFWKVLLVDPLPICWDILSSFWILIELGIDIKPDLGVETNHELQSLARTY